MDDDSAPRSLRQLALPEGTAGTLWLSSMPGRWEPWADFVDEARHIDLALTLCLTEPEEIAQLSPAYRAALDAGGMPGRWFNLPARNFGIPEEARALGQAVDTVVASLRGGQAVLLHCAAGMGRTGMVAACVLKRLGLPIDEALRRVREAGSNPQSALQSGLIDGF
jgi:Tyrosine phosphatase family